MKSVSYRCFALLLLLLLLFTACTSGNPVAPETSAEENTANTTEASASETSRPLIRDGEAVYQILRPDICSSWALNTAIAVRSGLLEQSGVTFGIDNDFAKNEEDIDNDAYEILIGNTNRAASRHVLQEGLGLYDYVISVDGNKIVLCGGSDYALEAAGREFLALAETYDYVLPEDLSVHKTVGRSPYLIGATNQKESAVEVYDIGTGVLSAESRVFRFSCSEYNIAGLKFRNYRDKQVMLAAYGASSAIMVSYPDGEELWRTTGTASNPHSVELIPFADGSYLIAVAASSGAEVRFFDPEGTNPQTPILSLSYTDAHGVLWDPAGECLWILGTNQLSKYRVERKGASAEATLISAYTAPGSGGHDLAPVYGDQNLLWLSTSSMVYQFNKTTETFSTDYPGNQYLKRSGVKGIGNFSDGSILWIIPDGGFKSWTSASFSFGKQIGSSYALYAPNSETGAFYKVRVWSTDYQ